MSVLCIWPESEHVEDISPYMTFEKFETHLLNLDMNVKQGGYFVIYNASFCFTDSKIADSYEPIIIEGHEISGFVKKFNRNNHSMGDAFVYPYVIFKKI
jgi:hypothetical protein